MNKKQKLFIGVGLIGLTAYFLLKKKKTTNFVQSDLDACIRANPTSDLSKCCDQVGGIIVNGVCGVAPQNAEEQCIANGGTYDAKTSTCNNSKISPPRKEVLLQEEVVLTPSSNGGSSSGIVSSGSNILVANPNSVILVPPTSPLYSGDMSKALGFPSDGGGGGAEKKSEFDWIPYIMGGTTLALAYVQENY
jgi:hypothetical protein